MLMMFLILLVGCEASQPVFSPIVLNSHVVESEADIHFQVASQNTVVFEANSGTGTGFELFSADLRGILDLKRITPVLPNHQSDILEFQVCGGSVAFLYRASADAPVRLMAGIIQARESAWLVDPEPPLTASGTTKFAWSHNCRRLVFTSDADDSFHSALYVREFDKSKPPLRMSHVGGRVLNFALSADGTQVVYLAKDLLSDERKMYFGNSEFPSVAQLVQREMITSEGAREFPTFAQVGGLRDSDTSSFAIVALIGHFEMTTSVAWVEMRVSLVSSSSSQVGTWFSIGGPYFSGVQISRAEVAPDGDHLLWTRATFNVSTALWGSFISPTAEAYQLSPPGEQVVTFAATRSKIIFQTLRSVFSTPFPLRGEPPRDLWPNPWYQGGSVQSFIFDSTTNHVLFTANYVGPVQRDLFVVDVDTEVVHHHSSELYPGQEVREAVVLLNNATFGRAGGGAVAYVVHPVSQMIEPGYAGGQLWISPLSANARPVPVLDSTVHASALLVSSEQSSLVYRASLPAVEGSTPKIFQDRVDDSRFTFLAPTPAPPTASPPTAPSPIPPVPSEDAVTVTCKTRSARMARSCAPTDACSGGRDGAAWSRPELVADGVIFSYTTVTLNNENQPRTRNLYAFGYGWDAEVPSGATLTSLTVQPRFWNSDGGVYIPNNGLTMVRNADEVPDAYGDIFEEHENNEVRLALATVIQDGPAVGQSGWRHGLPSVEQLRQPFFGIALRLQHDGRLGGPPLANAVISELEMTVCYSETDISLQPASPAAGLLGKVLPPKDGMLTFEWDSALYSVDLGTYKRSPVGPRVPTGLQQVEQCGDVIVSLSKLEVPPSNANGLCCCASKNPRWNVPCQQQNVQTCIAANNVCVTLATGGELSLANTATGLRATLFSSGVHSFRFRGNCQQIAFVTAVSPDASSARFLHSTMLPDGGSYHGSDAVEQQVLAASGHLFATNASRTRLQVTLPSELFVLHLVPATGALEAEYARLNVGDVPVYEEGRVHNYGVIGDDVLFVADVPNSTSVALFFCALPPVEIVRISPLLERAQLPLIFLSSPDLRYTVFYASGTSLMATESRRPQSLTILWDNPGVERVIICPTSTHAVFVGPFDAVVGHSMYVAALDGSTARQNVNRHPEMQLRIPPGLRVDHLVCTGSGDRVVFRARLGMEQQLWMTSLVDPEAAPFRLDASIDARSDVFYLTPYDQFFLYADGNRLRMKALPEFPHQAPENAELKEYSTALTAPLGAGQVVDFQQYGADHFVLLWRRLTPDAHTGLYSVRVSRGASSLLRLTGANHTRISNFKVCDSGLWLIYLLQGGDLYAVATTGGVQVPLDVNVIAYDPNAACTQVAIRNADNVLVKRSILEQSVEQVAPQAFHFAWAADETLFFETSSDVHTFVVSSNRLWMAAASSTSLMVHGPASHVVYEGPNVLSVQFSDSSPMLYFIVGSGGSGELYGFALSSNVGGTAVKMSPAPQQLPIVLSTAGNWIISGPSLQLAYNEVPVRELLPFARATNHLLTPSASRVVYAEGGKIFTVPVEGPVRVPYELDAFVKRFGATTQGSLLEVTQDSAVVLFLVRQMSSFQLWISGTNGLTLAMRLSDIHSRLGGVGRFKLTKDSSHVVYGAGDLDGCPECHGLYAVSIPEGFEAPTDVVNPSKCNRDGVCGPLEDCIGCSMDCPVLPDACCSGSYSAGCLPSSKAFPLCMQICTAPPTLSRPCPDAGLEEGVTQWGDLSFDENQFAGTCDPHPDQGGEETFEFVAQTAGDHLVRVTGGASFVLYVRADSCTGEELACGLSNVVNVSLHVMQKVIIVVDAARTVDQTAFQVSVTGPGGVQPPASAPCRVGFVTVPCAEDGTPLIHKRETIDSLMFNEGDVLSFSARGQLVSKQGIEINGGEIRLVGEFSPAAYVLIQAGGTLSVSKEVRFTGSNQCITTPMVQPLNSLEIIVSATCPGSDVSVAGIIIGVLIILALLTVAGLLLRKYLRREPVKMTGVARPEIASQAEPTLEDINLDEYELRVKVDDEEGDFD